MIFKIFLALLLVAPSLSVAAPKKACPFYLSARRQLLDRSFVIHPPRKGGKSSYVRVAFFDADSTLRKPKKGMFVRKPSDVVILPGVVEKLRELNNEGYLVAIVSNQGGIPNQLSFKDADQNLLKTVTLLREGGAIVHYFDFAEARNINRKPGIGMGTNLETVLKLEYPDSPVRIDWRHSFMVGDAAYMKGEIRPDGTKGHDFTNTDRLFAEALEIPFEEARYFFGWKKKKE